MGWAGPMPNARGRMVGYAVRGICDLDGCDKKIDRGLGYVCGGMHDGGEHGCGGYFCGRHLMIGAEDQLCESCYEEWKKDHTCPECGEPLIGPHEGDQWCPECDSPDTAASPLSDEERARMEIASTPPEGWPFRSDTLDDKRSPE